jgi:hypothetical protein
MSTQPITPTTATSIATAPPSHVVGRRLAVIAGSTILTLTALAIYAAGQAVAVATLGTASASTFTAASIVLIAMSAASLVVAIVAPRSRWANHIWAFASFGTLGYLMLQGAHSAWFMAWIFGGGPLALAALRGYAERHLPR